MRVLMRPFLQAAEVGAAWYPCIFGEVCFAWPIQGAFCGSPGNNLDAACATLSGNGADWPYSLDRLRASGVAIHVSWRVGIPFCCNTSGFLSEDWNQRGCGNGNI